MTKEELRKIVSQIKKYELVNEFKNKDAVDKWLSSLNEKQINNFISLKISRDEIAFPIDYLINFNLLNCDDYVNRVSAMSKIKNGDGRYLFNMLCHPNFLNSKNYYKDLEKIGKAGGFKHALWVITEDVFINSPYHDEDLDLILNSKDTDVAADEYGNSLVAEALNMVAEDKNSINSPYHRQDMKLIASSGSKCLQSSGCYPDRGINKLAINEVSLKDRYHLENMKILSKAPVSDRQLYDIMTNPNIIKGKYYRKEVELLAASKSEITAIAMYNYIVNPEKRDTIGLYDILCDTGLDVLDIGLLNRRGCISGKQDKNYLENLILLSKVPDVYVMFIENILTDKYNLRSAHQKFDIDLLLSVTDIDIFMDLFRLMTYDVSLFGGHHVEDALLISKTSDKEIRRLLLQKATDKYSINSEHHRYDMDYITKLDLKNISKEIWEKMKYYLFTGVGIKDAEHISMLEKLSKGIIVDKNVVILEYLNKLEEEGFDEVIIEEKTAMIDNKKTNKGFAKVRKIFGRR